MKKLIKQIPVILCIVFTPLLVTAGSLDHIKVDTSFISIEEGKANKWKNIAVLPFTGNKIYRKPMAELFTYYIKKQNNYKIIDPAVIETELEKTGVTYDGTEENAFKSGKKLGFCAIITGHITLEYNSWSGFKHSTEIKLLDIKSGKKAAHLIMYPPYLCSSHYKGFSMSTEKTGTYMLKILTEILAKIEPKIVVIVNPNEPWTGTWKVTGGPWGGFVLKLKQSGNMVKSIRGSDHDIKAKVKGDRLKGWYGDTVQIHIDFKISEDCTLFKGKGSWYQGNFYLNGERQE